MAQGEDPTQQELFDLQSYARAQELGIDVTLQTEYVWIGHEFSRAGVPSPWSEYSDDHGQIFYYNHETGDSQWVHPLIDTFKALFQKCKEEPGLTPFFRQLYGNLRQYCDDKKGWWALNLLITPSDGDPPMPDEVLDMAKYLQINLKKEPELTWIAKQAVQVPLPPHWQEHEDDSGNPYFYDTNTGKSQLKHPLDDYFFALVSEERKKIPQRRRDHPNDITVGWMPFIDEQGRTYYVSFQYNVQTYYPPWETKYNRAAAVIQRYVRRRQGYERMLNRCATKIQAAFRGHIVRDAVQAWREECAALCIQTMYRMYRARLEALREGSALVIQSCWRMHVCRKRFVRHRAAVRIQCAWRRRRAMELLRSHKAARTIQALWRGGKGREIGDELRLRRDAATAIQTAARGLLARRTVAAMRRERAATLIQSHVRRRAGARRMREERYRQKKESATLVIQTHCRRYLAMKRADELRMDIVREYAATYVQKCWRGWEARQYVLWIRQTRAAEAIQGAFRRWRRRVAPVRYAAAVAIQRLYRGYKARKWVEFVGNQEWAEINRQAAKIQAVWKGWHQRSVAKKNKAALAIQKLVRGRQQRTKWRVLKAASMIQRNWRMYRERKVWIHKIRAVRLVACRMQCLYRLHVSHRRAIVFRMMHEYRMSMARRIQHAWFGLMARRDLQEHLEKLQVKRAAAVRIQKIFRGHRAKRHAEHLRRAYVKLQGAIRTFRAVRKLQELRLLHKKRRKILAKLRPLYEALVIIPEGAVGPRRERLLDKYILNDQIPKGGDQLCVEALVTLETCETQLYDKCELRATRRDEAMQAFKVAWRLCSVPVHERAQVPTEGDAGWISDEVMNILREEEDRLRVKKMDNLEQYTKEAKAWVLRLWDDIPAQYSWRKTCRAALSKTVSMENLDSIVAEVGRMEELLPVTVHLSALLKKRNELIQKRAALPDSKTLMQDRSSGAEKRKKQAEAAVAMLDLEEPRCARALYNAISDLQKNADDLPVSLSTVKKVTGFPELSVLRAELDQAAARPPPASSAKPRKMAAVATAAMVKSRVDKAAKGAR